MSRIPRIVTMEHPAPPVRPVKTLWCLAAPPLIAAANVIAVYSLMSGHWSAIVRPLIVSTAAAAVLSLVVFALVQRTNSAAGISTTATLILTGHPVGLLAAMAILAWTARRQWLRMRQLRVGDFPGDLPGRVAATVLAISLAWVWVGGAVTWGDLTVVPRDARASSGDQGGARSIYLLLLDAYPRADTLSAVFGYDNSPFEDALADQGFVVYPDATSPTTRTERTVLSMLTAPGEMTEPEPEGWSPDGLEAFRRDTRRAFRSAGGVAAVRDAGYELVYVAGAASHVWLMDWDIVIHPEQLNDVEMALLRQAGLLRPLLGEWIIGMHRSGVEAGIQTWADQGTAPRPRLVLAHVTAPHAPLIYGTGPPKCWSGGCELWGYDVEDPEFRRQYISNLETLNDRVLAAISVLTKTDPSGIVMVLSDHGIRDGTEPEERRRSFLAARGTTMFESEPTVTHLLYRLAQ